MNKRLKYLIEKYGNEIGGERLKILILADPTPKKVYLQWLIGIERADPIKNEHLKQIKGLIGIFHSHKHDMPQRDIMTFGMEDFLLMMRDFHDSYDDIEGEVEVVFNGEEGRVLVPLTAKASKRLAEGADWCTRDEREFIKYHNEGRLYVFIPSMPSRSGEKYQLHTTRGEFRDEKENSFGRNKFPYPEMWAAFTESLSPVDKMIALDNGVVWTISGIGENILIHAIRNNPEIIHHIENPSEALQLAAVANDWNVIQHIDNPCRKARLMALERESSVYYMLDDPTPEEERMVTDGILEGLMGSGAWWEKLPFFKKGKRGKTSKRQRGRRGRGGIGVYDMDCEVGLDDPVDADDADDVDAILEAILMGDETCRGRPISGGDA